MPDPLPYATPPRLDPRVPKPSRRGAWRWGAGLTLIGLLLLGQLLPTRSGRRATANRIKSAVKLRNIGREMAVLARNHGDRYPADLDLLLLAESRPPAALVYPDGPDTPAPGPTPARRAAAYRAGGHGSYVWCGGGLHLSAPPEVILAFEADAQGSAGRNFLFADGHVEGLSAADTNHAINELASGHNPPRP